MSNPEHSLDRQKRRHAGPLVGMAVVVIAVLAGLFWWLSHEAAEAPGPTGAGTQIDGRTGAETGTDPAAQPVEAAPNPAPAAGNATPEADTAP